MKNQIEINGIIAKVGNSEITEEEQYKIMDDIFETLQKKGYYFGGGFNLLSDEDFE